MSNFNEWGLPLPVFQFINPEEPNFNSYLYNAEITLYISELIKNYGYNILYDWNIKDLLPIKYKKHAKNLKIHSDFVFNYHFINTLSLILNT